MAATVIVGIAAFGVSLLTLFSGFGLGTLLMPVFALFFPVEVAVASTAVVHAANNLFKVGLLARRAPLDVIVRFGAPAIVASFFGAVPDGAHVLATCGGVCKGSTVATLAHPGTALLPLTGQLAAEEVVVALVWATAGADLDLRLSFRADGDERCVAAWK